MHEMKSRRIEKKEYFFCENVVSCIVSTIVFFVVTDERENEILLEAKLQKERFFCEKSAKIKTLKKNLP